MIFVHHTYTMKSNPYLLSVIIFVIAVVIAVITSGRSKQVKGILNRVQKVDGMTTHKRSVDFNEKTSILNYDTISGGSLGIRRGILNDTSKKVIGALEKDALADVMKMAGVVKEIGIDAEEIEGAALIV